jgi:hypothetical protein
VTTLTVNVSVTISAETLAALREVALAVLVYVGSRSAELPIARPAANKPGLEVKTEAKAAADHVPRAQAIVHPGEVAASSNVPVLQTWSSERNDLLAALRAQGVSSYDSLLALNKLPGAPIASPGAVEAQYFKLKRSGLILEPLQPTPRRLAVPAKPKFTPDRVNLLRVLLLDGADDDVIRERLNELPGHELGRTAVRDFLRNPKNAGRFPAPQRDKARDKTHATPPAMTAAQVIERREAGSTPVGAAQRFAVTEQKLPAPPVTVDYNQARSWAEQRGLVAVDQALDIDKVNAKRRALGLPVFVMRAKVMP